MSPTDLWMKRCNEENHLNPSRLHRIGRTDPHCVTVCRLARRYWRGSSLAQLGVRFAYNTNLSRLSHLDHHQSIMEAWNKFTQSVTQGAAQLSQNAAPIGEKFTRGFGTLVRRWTS